MANCALCLLELTSPSLFWSNMLHRIHELGCIQTFENQPLAVHQYCRIQTGNCQHLFHSLCLYVYRDMCLKKFPPRNGKSLLGMICPSIRKPCNSTWTTWSDIEAYDPAMSLPLRTNIMTIAPSGGPRLLPFTRTKDRAALTHPSFFKRCQTVLDGLRLDIYRNREEFPKRKQPPLIDLTTDSSEDEHSSMDSPILQEALKRRKRELPGAGTTSNDSDVDRMSSSQAASIQETSENKSEGLINDIDWLLDNFPQMNRLTEISEAELTTSVNAILENQESSNTDVINAAMTAANILED